MDIHVISLVASAVWVCSGKFVVTNEKHFHSEVALCIQKEGDCSNNLNYSYDKTVWALYSTTVFFISWGPLFPVFVFVYYYMRHGKYFVC